MGWSINQFLKINGFNDIDLFYDSRQGFLINIEDVDKISDELCTWCQENECILFLIDCYSKSGWDWSLNFCEPSDLFPILDANWINDDDPIKISARRFINTGGMSVQDELLKIHPPDSTRKCVHKHGYVYILRAPNMNPNIYKIGREQTKNARVDELGIKLPWNLELVAHIESDDYIGLETELHQKFANKRDKGEWFFLTEEDIEWIKRLDGHVETR